MPEVLQIALMVTSPFALIAFIAALFFFGRQSELSKQQKILESVPEKERFKLVEEGFTRYKLTAADLTREQKYNLLLSELTQRHKRSMRNGTALFLAFVVLLIFLFGVYWYSKSPAQEKVVAPPIEFETHQARFSYGLPEEVFGAIQDAARGREWLESLDASAKA